MKKNYTFLIALVLFFNFSAFAQTSPPWGFDNTVEGFVGSNFSSIAPGPNFATYSIVGTSPNPNLDNDNVSIDTSLGNYIALTIQNQTGSTKVQVITNRSSSPAFTNFEGLTPNDTGFTTYYVNMTSNNGWTGTLTDITFRFKGDTPAQRAGDVLFDNIEIVSEIPSTPRVDYTFDDTTDSEGFVSGNGVTLSQPNAGEIELTISDASQFPKFEQTGIYSVDADTYKGIQITLINNSPKNQITIVVPGSPNQFASGAMTPNDPNPQTVEISLIPEEDDDPNNWTGTQTNWWLQLIEKPDPDTPPVTSAGTIIIQQILFVDQILSVEENNLENSQIVVFPNPVKNLLTIKSNSNIQKMEVYSILGQMSLVQNDINTLDTSSLPDGVYILKIYQENLTTTKRFIKK